MSRANNTALGLLNTQVKFMEIKLSSMEQIDLLTKGNVIIKFPSFGGPVDVYDKVQKKYIEYYEIRSVKYGKELFELVMTGESVFSCSLPGDIGRIFIKPCDLITERVWWQDIPADHW